jgi:hypothetical protein
VVLTAKYFRRIEKWLKSVSSVENVEEFWDFGYETTDETNCLNGYVLKIRLNVIESTNKLSQKV